MKRIISKGDDFVVDTLFYFKPVQRFEYRGDMFVLGVLVTARAREFCKNWRRDIWVYFFVSGRILKCNFDNAKANVYRSFNSIFSKVGRSRHPVN